MISVKEVLTTYCMCQLDTLPRMNTQNQKNLICGAYALNEKQRVNLTKLGYYFDDTATSISYLNTTFCELTGIYWVWKNTQDEVVGTSHYRRFWTEGELLSLEYKSDTLYIAGPIWFSSNVFGNFIGYHGSRAIDTIGSLINEQRIPLLRDDFFGLQENNVIYGTLCNMFFCERTLFNRICETLFSILFEVFRVDFEYVGTLDHYQRRYVGFVSELVLSALIQNPQYYFGVNDVQYVTYLTAE